MGQDELVNCSGGLRPGRIPEDDRRRWMSLRRPVAPPFDVLNVEPGFDIITWSSDLQPEEKQFQEKGHGWAHMGAGQHWAPGLGWRQKGKRR